MPGLYRCWLLQQQTIKQAGHSIMRIFVTGATGFVGSAIVEELIGAGHRVVGLARSVAAATALLACGAEPLRGDLEDPETLHAGAASADGVIHTAFNHDFSRFQASCEADGRVIETLGAALAGSDRPLVITSAIGILPQGHLLEEATLPASGPAAHPRAASEKAANVVAERGTRVSVVRLPPSVHGDGDHGFVPAAIRFAREAGVSAFIGDGMNQWPAVHRADAARLYWMVVERGTTGSRYHAVAEQGVPFHDIAEVIARRLDTPLASKSPEEAAPHFRWFAHFAAMDVPASSEWTQKQLGWTPSEVDLLKDVDRPEYFLV